MADFSVRIKLKDNPNEFKIKMPSCDWSLKEKLELNLLSPYIETILIKGNSQTLIFNKTMMEYGFIEVEKI